MLHTCPKCNSQFPLEPLDESNQPVDYKLPPEEFDIAKAYEQPEPDSFASAPTVLASALTGSEVVAVPPPAVPQQQSMPIPQRDVDLDYTPHASISSDMPFTFCLIALALFGMGMLSTQFPYGRFISLPLLVAGLILGLLALPGLTGREKYGWGAIAANTMGLVFVVLLPSWLGLSAWLPPGDPNAGPKPVLAISKTDGSRIPSETVDAYKAVWEQDDVRVEVKQAMIEMQDPKAKPGAPGQKRVLRLVLKITNVGVSRPIPYTGWAKTPETSPKLSEPNGSLTYLTTEAGPAAPILFGKETEVTLVFEPPAKAFEELSLELVPSGLGSIDAVKFRIPAAMVAGAIQPKK